MNIASTLEDLLLTTIDEALQDEGYMPLANQPFAGDIMERALESLRDDDASFQEAARSAVKANTHKLTEENAAHPEGCRCDECFLEWIDRAYHLAVDRELMAHG